MALDCIVLVSIFKGILFAQAECCKSPPELVRLWLHEAERVYRDKLVDEKDLETYDKLKKDIVKKSFEVIDTWQPSQY